MRNAITNCHWSERYEINPGEGIDGLTGEFAKVYKVYFMDGTEEYVDADMLADIENGEFEVIEE